MRTNYLLHVVEFFMRFLCFKRSSASMERRKSWYDFLMGYIKQSSVFEVFGQAEAECGIGKVAGGIEMPSWRRNELIDL